MEIPFNGEEVLKYYSNITKEPLHRYRSWEHCYEAFCKIDNTESLCLHLACYLASWGMYRGSSGILQKNYKIHLGAVKLLKSNKYASLRCSSNKHIQLDKISLIFDLIQKLKSYYKSISSGTVSPTDTLISKILLGTLYCIPAYDRYFIIGMRKIGLKTNKLNKKSLEQLFEYVHNKKNLKSIEECQKIINKNSKIKYPIMKIIDMNFWYMGKS